MMFILFKINKKCLERKIQAMNTAFIIYVQCDRVIFVSFTLVVLSTTNKITNEGIYFKISYIQDLI